ncbi:DUF4291 family protein [Streptomyces sp. NBC_01635]|uniref:DUF4291 family protein n=1 Tax=Streptomyces sp. NBC_01635 TaxID=2975904 RepID=UPI0038661D39
MACAKKCPPCPVAEPKYRIRAPYTDSTVTVHQAYAPGIGLPTAGEGRFPSVWQRNRMTWITMPRSQTSTGRRSRWPRFAPHQRRRPPRSALGGEESAATEGPTGGPLSHGRLRVLRCQSNATTKRTPSSPKRPARAFITAKTCGQ